MSVCQGILLNLSKEDFLHAPHTKSRLTFLLRDAFKSICYSYHCYIGPQQLLGKQCAKLSCFTLHQTVLASSSNACSEMIA